jgi:predicted PurR-regulated permease PerM
VDIVYFTITAAVLYLAADRLLDAMERRVGRRFEQRSLIFFALLLSMALIAFAIIRNLSGEG